MTPERDAVSCCSYVNAIAPAVYAADQAGALVDLRDYRSATVLLHIGVGGITFSGTNKIEFVLQAGNASDGSDLANVTDDEVLNIDSVAPPSIANGIVRALVAAHAAATVQKIGYIGGKRYLKLTADFSGTHGTGTPISALVELEVGETQRVA
ncbi:MAG: hypothetical protein ACR652_17330 [Methylocystis sp.]|uniref:hypothetical protein n=1 Tax=Methylocystis sp. TaxID=1911079 RepID=UPI003DA57754